MKHLFIILIMFLSAGAFAWFTTWSSADYPESMAAAQILGVRAIEVAASLSFIYIVMLIYYAIKNQRNEK